MKRCDVIINVVSKVSMLLSGSLRQCKPDSFDQTKLKGLIHESTVCEEFHVKTEVAFTHHLV
jgi:hypothetical protein